MHKRLVVPQLGAFLVKEAGVTVLFSELLKRDDGVLCSLLCAEGRSEIEAAGMIDRFVYEVRCAIAQGQAYRIEGLGRLVPGPNGTIAFHYDPALTRSGAEALQPEAAAEPAEPAGPAESAESSVPPVAPAPAAPVCEPAAGRKREEQPKAAAASHGSAVSEWTGRPEPYVRGLRYGKPLKTTDAYTYVERGTVHHRRVDRFLLLAILAAVIAMVAIAFGFWREARERQAEAEAQQVEQSLFGEEPGSTL